MAKYTSYTNRVTLKPIPKGFPKEEHLPAIRGEEHDIFEAPFSKADCQSLLENDPLADEVRPTFLPPDGKAVWTWGVATCHVICMYGWVQGRLGWDCGIALFHLTDAFSIKQGLEACWKVLNNRGYSQSITSYIIGGQPVSDGKLSNLSTLNSLYTIRGIVAPLTTNDGGSALVIATRRWLAFNVYDEMDEASLFAKLAQLQKMQSWSGQT